MLGDDLSGLWLGPTGHATVGIAIEMNAWEEGFLKVKVEGFNFKLASHALTQSEEETWAKIIACWGK